ncbi:MAG: AAA family ATPase [bacterium]
MTDPPQLIQSLQDPSIYPHSVDSFHLIETHISWVLLTGDYAYKIKKSVKYDFVDFSSLSRRKRYCKKELELNRRLSPEIYEAVIKITGTPENPTLDGDQQAIEYAVKMEQFNQEDLFSARSERDELSRETIDKLAQTVSDFHAGIQDSPPSSDYASPDLIKENVEENFEEIELDHFDGDTRQSLEWIRSWSRDRFDDLSSLMQARRRNGAVRNCHGDMHLKNIAEHNDEINIFDCIEFNESFRWIDVIDEIAFLTMDLVDRGHPELANRFIDRYLMYSDQYDGLPLLDFYRCYRAMVRCKVSYLQADPPAEDGTLPDEFYDYLETAKFFTETPDPLLMITHGLSGSGKTTVTQEILETIGAIRLRSDVERKRLAGLDYTEEAGEELYSEQVTRKTYELLRNKGETVLRAGLPLIVDATFLKHEFRKQFRGLAEKLEVPFRILSVECDVSTLRDRLKQRQSEEATVSDAGTDVLDYQLETRDSLEPAEEVDSLKIKTDGDGLTSDHITLIKSLTE